MTGDEIFEIDDTLRLKQFALTNTSKDQNLVISPGALLDGEIGSRFMDGTKFIPWAGDRGLPLFYLMLQHNPLKCQGGHDCRFKYFA